MPELLLEVLSEEIPARMQTRAAEDLRRLVCEGLEEVGLKCSEAESFATPRRLALLVDGLPKRQPDAREEKRGPREGAPEQAIQGFLKANGLSSIDQAELRETDKGKVYFLVREVPGRRTAEVLPEVIGAALRALSWPKSMRWNAGAFRWVRPLHAVLAVFNGKRLTGAVELGAAEFAFGNRTVGHRFLAPKAFAVANFKDYKAKLKTAKVILDPAERKAIIEKKAAQLAAKQGLTVKSDPGLLEEVAGLIEWPVPLLGRIDQEFMDLPPEVLTTSLRSHQKYFVTQDETGRLADRFVIVSNMTTADRGKTIVAGNERVLRARLSDARFFWDQDRKASLASRAPALKQIVFHAKLGTLDEKVDRMQALAAEIARHVPGADLDRVRSAARLAKADLTSGMVGEFPELQGIMGRYYARHDGEHEEVAEAIAAHYAPQGPNDACPSAPVSVCVALADKIDSLVGFFAVDEKPTGSKDPYALRRAALGVIRLIVENGLRLPLFEILEASARLYRSLGSEAVTGPLVDFFAERLKVALRDRGVRHDLISAVFALGGEDDLVRLLARVEALEGFLGSDDGANLLVAYRRAANIVRIEQKKDKATYNGGAEASALAQDEEKHLFAALNRASETAGAALSKEDFTGAMAALAGLRRPVDAFFDHVTVNSEDAALRENRLRLLSAIGGTLGRVADFSKIEG
ncbi:MAG: glycine--tRNA ligase subunit beta [Kiloniellales bacterium]|nr:glycine--tRNA ligase subunit beta [Kiloniellales bacterium]